MRTGLAEVCLDKPRAAWMPVGEFLSTLLQTVAQQRCRFLHDKISRAVEGKYRCWTCHREFETDW